MSHFNILDWIQAQILLWKFEWDMRFVEAKTKEERQTRQVSLRVTVVGDVSDQRGGIICQLNVRESPLWLLRDIYWAQQVLVSRTIR